METKFLLSNKFKPVGWLLFIGSALVWAYSVLFYPADNVQLRTKVFVIYGNDAFGKGGSESKYFSFLETDIFPTMIALLFILGGLLLAFSKEKTEDEFIAKLRLQSFQWAFLCNYVVLFLLFFFMYGFEFLFVLQYYMFVMLILFICRFHYLLYKNKN